MRCLMYTNERCIIFDESGNLGKSGRYFVIACIDTMECKSLHNIIKRKLKKAKDLFPELGVKHSHEVKANEAYPCVKHHILECIVSKNVKVSYIVADLQHVTPKLLEDKNIFYNYMMKLLISKIITENDKGTTINILCDNKTTKVASANSFKDYIKLYLNYECQYDLDLNIKYMNSDAGDSYVVQAADYVANAIYTNYEYNNIIYHDVLVKYIDIKEQFPRKKFGE